MLRMEPEPETVAIAVGAAFVVADAAPAVPPNPTHNVLKICDVENLTGFAVRELSRSPLTTMLYALMLMKTMH